jgi:hypothetical protein
MSAQIIEMRPGIRQSAAAVTCDDHPYSAMRRTKLSRVVDVLSQVIAMDGRPQRARRHY